MSDAAGYKLERYDDILRNNRQVYEWTDISDEIKASSTSYEETSGELVCGQSHEYRVSAKGDGSTYSTNFGATASDSAVIACPVAAPAPKGLMTATTGPTSIQVSWDAVIDAQDYRLQRYGSLVRQARQTQGWLDVAEGITATSYAVTAANSNELNPILCGQTHQFRVSARGDGWPYSTAYDNNSKTVDGSTQQCPRPPAPTGVTAVESGLTSITVSWDARDGVRFYQVDRFFTGIRSDSDNSQSTRSDWVPIVEEFDGTSHTVKSADLICAQDHQFRVSGKGDGLIYAAVYGDATEASGRILCPPPPPSLTPASRPTSITISWLGLQGVTYTFGDTANPPTYAGAGIEIDHEVSGLQECTEYSFTVTASGDGIRYSDREGSETSDTEEASTVCLVPPPTPALTPAVSPTSITISWYGEVGVTYVVSGDSSSPTLTGADDEIVHEVTGLQDCTSYSFTVTATGDGMLFSNRPDDATSAAKDVITECLDDPPAPVLRVSAGRTSITVSWHGEQGVMYVVSGDSSSPTLTGAGRDIDHEVTGLQECTDYSFTVTATGDGRLYTNRDGTETSDTEDGRTLCQVPEHTLNISDPELTTLKVSWTGLPSLSYGLDHRLSTGGARSTQQLPWKLVEDSITVPTSMSSTVERVVENLPCGSSIDFRLRILSLGGEYPTGSTREDTGNGNTAPCGPPPMPTGLVATPTAQNSITVSWNTDPNVAVYKLEHAVAGTPTPTWMARVVTPASSTATPMPTSDTVEMLKLCDTNYRFRVSGKGSGSPYNNTEFGEPSEEATSSIPCPAPAPANVIATPTAQDKITVSWDTDGSVATYKLEYAVAGTPTPTWSAVATVTPAPASTPTSYEVTSTSSLSLTLTCGTEYLFRVSAIGDGMAHNGITYSSFSFGDTSDPLDPSAAAATGFFCTPQNLTVTPLAQRRAELSWDEVDNPNMNFEKYVVQVVKFDDDFPASPGSNIHDTMSDQHL